MYDYPFTSWEEYSDAFVDGLTRFYYDEKYPKYAEILGIYGDRDRKQELDFIVELVEKYNENPQTIMDGFLKSICKLGNDNQVYMFDCGQNNIIDYLLEKGANLNKDILTDETYKTELSEDILEYYEEIANKNDE